MIPIRYRFASALCLAALALAACSKSAPETQAPAPEGQAPAPAVTGGAASPATPAAQAGKTLTIGVMPKLVGIDFFNAVEKGAREAGKDLGVTVVYDGPVTGDVTKQTAMLDGWIQKGFDAICIAPNDPAAIAPTLRKAQKRGIKVLAFDADASADARDFFINQATYDAVGRTMMDIMARGIGPEGKYIILTGNLTAENQNRWMAAMETYRQEKYPQMVNLSESPKATAEDQALATQVTIDVLKTYPDLQGIFALTSVALPGAAEGLVKENAYSRIFLTGLSTPKTMRDYVHKGVVKEFALWNPVDLGYLAVQAAALAVKGGLTPQTTQIKAGRLGDIKVSDRVVLLGDPLIFTKDNIDQYEF
ncbi:MAG: substrate-binding domain-containing protein [bacterium]|nr:substrate-binding domain-containing protein [bacterium]